MKKNNSKKFIEDVQKVASSAMTTVLSASKDAEKNFKKMLNKYLSKSDFVTREEFDVLKEMVLSMKRDRANSSGPSVVQSNPINLTTKGGKKMKKKTVAKKAPAKKAAVKKAPAKAAVAKKAPAKKAVAKKTVAKKAPAKKAAVKK